MLVPVCLGFSLFLSRCVDGFSNWCVCVCTRVRTQISNQISTHRRDESTVLCNDSISENDRWLDLLSIRIETNWTEMYIRSHVAKMMMWKHTSDKHIARHLSSAEHNELPHLVEFAHALSLSHRTHQANIFGPQLNRQAVWFSEQIIFIYSVWFRAIVRVRTVSIDWWPNRFKPKKTTTEMKT